jgi:uncharacterized protein with HEPN domain
MRKEFRHALDDILQAIGGIQTAVDGKVFEDFEREWLLRLAISGPLKSSRKPAVPCPTRSRQYVPRFPGLKIKAVGNVLRHGYESLSQPVIWNVLVDELPRLKDAVEAILEVVGPENDGA